MTCSVITLTPALSLTERGNYFPSHAMLNDGDWSGRPSENKIKQWLFPLPAGEGQDEGDPPNQNPAPKNL